MHRCVSALEDMREETETAISLASEELHTLLAHESKYRKMIEQSEHVFIALDGTTGVRVRGGAKAVASASRALQELFRSSCLSTLSRRAAEVPADAVPARTAGEREDEGAEDAAGAVSRVPGSGREAGGAARAGHVERPASDAGEGEAMA